MVDIWPFISISWNRKYTLHVTQFLDMIVEIKTLLESYNILEFADVVAMI